ncbi:MAG: aldehyde dehydrogenase family protein [Limisphaerales bacterium]
MAAPVTILNPPSASPAESVDSLVATARQAALLAQTGWAATPVRDRVAILRRARRLIASHAEQLAEASAAARRRPVLESLTAEVIPLAEACRFLERNAERLLAPGRLGRRGRPLWLNGTVTEIHREPLGVVLIIAPSNYPLFLPGVQLLQALAAGNAVLLKPGANGTAAAQTLVNLLHHAGLDHRLAQVLPESPRAAQSAIAAGVAKVFLTGSATTGAAVYAELAPRLIPATMELSGCDAVLVRADADLDLTARALRFGLELNNGATCIAPRRVFVHRAVASQLEGRLAALPGAAAPLELALHVRRHIDDALAQGAHLIQGRLLSDQACLPPLVIAGASTSMRLLHEDIFAPVMSLVTAEDDHEAVAMANDCPYALGATIFSADETAARELAARLNAGLVIINDLIVPSADPRVPFGGRGRSGFGVTRGADGLLEMTAPKVVTVRRSRFLPHLDAPGANDAELFRQFLVLQHGTGLKARWQALKTILRLARARRQNSSNR